MDDASRGEIGPSGLFVPLDLPPQGIQGFKALFRAEIVQEIDLDVSAVQVTLIIEQVDFQLLAGALHGGTTADIGDAGPGPQFGSAQQHGVDAINRGDAAVQVDVRGRKANRAATSVAVRHPSAHVVRPTQQPRRQFKSPWPSACRMRVLLTRSPSRM